MTKENNSGDANKLYLTLHEVDSLILENCKTGKKATSFCRIKNKEQEDKNIYWLVVPRT